MQLMGEPLLLNVDEILNNLARLRESHDYALEQMRGQLEQLRRSCEAKTTAVPDANDPTGGSYSDYSKITFSAAAPQQPQVTTPREDDSAFEEAACAIPVADEECLCSPGLVSRESKASWQSHGSSVASGLSDVSVVEDSMAAALSPMGATRSIDSTQSRMESRNFFNVFYEKDYVCQAIAADSNATELWRGTKEALYAKDGVGVLKRLAKLQRLWAEAKGPPRTGVFAAIVKSNTFAVFIAVVILTHCISSIFEINERADHFLSGDSEFKSNEAWSILDDAFLGVYIFELLLRMVVFRLYFLAGPDFWWNMIDLAIVLLASLNVMGGSVRAVRLFKISRLLRMLRFLRFIKTLRLLVDCLVQSLIHLTWCLLMLSFILAFFALYFVQAVTQHVEENPGDLTNGQLTQVKKYFGSFQSGMNSLFQACSGGTDWNYYYNALLATGSFNAVVFLFFICFFFLAIFNVVTSIFVERVISLSQPDMEDRVVEMQASSRKFAEDFYYLCKNIVDEDIHGHITFQQFDHLLQHSNVRDMLSVRGVDIHETRHFFDLIAMSESKGEKVKSISLEMLAAVCMRTKGMATSVDLLTLRYETRQSILQVSKNQQKLMEALDQIQRIKRSKHSKHHNVLQTVRCLPIQAATQEHQKDLHDDRIPNMQDLHSAMSKEYTASMMSARSSGSERSAQARSPLPVENEEVVQICHNTKELLQVAERQSDCRQASSSKSGDCSAVRFQDSHDEMQSTSL